MNLDWKLKSSATLLDLRRTINNIVDSEFVFNIYNRFGEIDVMENADDICYKSVHRILSDFEV